MTRTILIEVSDPTFTGGEAYLFVKNIETMETAVADALEQYLEFTDIRDRVGFVNDNLKHYDECLGCIDPVKLHDFNLTVPEEDFAKYWVDSYYEGEGSLEFDAKVLSLEEHPDLEDVCERFEEMKPGELLRSTHCNDQNTRRKISKEFFNFSEFNVF